MSAFRLHINHSTFSKADILHWNGQHTNTYTSDVLMLCKQWLDEKQNFELKTSGSTGTPKTISIQRSQIEASAQATLDFFNLKADNKVVCPLNIHVIGGQMMLYRSLIGELELYVIPADRSLSQLDTSVIYDFMPISAIQLFDVLSNAPEKVLALNSLQHLLIGGSNISEALQDLITTKLTCHVWQSYGMTETVSHIAMRSLHPGIEPAYTILNGIETALDERSCLKIKGAITNNIWIQTNDQVKKTDHTHFTFLGRTDFAVNSGGIKIQVEPIEKIIETLFTERNIKAPFFIGGIADDSLGEKLVLIVDTAFISEEEKYHLMQQLKEQLPKYHVPKEVHTATFEYTASGKINRKDTIRKILQKR
jgi:O-succinylbenzoic acid--CoA ligase